MHIRGHEKVAGSLKLGGSHYLAMSLFPELTLRFRKKHERVQFDFRSMNTYSITQELLTGQIDFALSFNTDPHPYLSKEILQKGKLVIAVRKNHPLVKSKNWAAKISEYSCLGHKSGSLIEKCDQHPIYNKLGIIPRIAALWDNDLIGTQILKMSDDWSLIPDYIAKREKLAILKLPQSMEAHYEISLLWNKHSFRLDFLDPLKKEISLLLKQSPAP